MINRAYSTSQFWDGRAESLEEQAKGPLANPIEMTSTRRPPTAHRETVKRIKAVPGYVSASRPPSATTPSTSTTSPRSIATFERTVLSGNSPYDRYQAGDNQGDDPRAVRGMDVFFNKTACDAATSGSTSPMALI